MNINGLHTAKSLYSPPTDEEQKPKPLQAYFVLEYSPSQKAFHIEPFAEMIANNARSFARGCLNDYSPIAMAITRERLEQAAEGLKQRGYANK